MGNRPLNFRGSTASSIIYQGNTVVHVIETGPHCNNANRTVFYKWNTAPSLSVGSGTTSRTVTVTTNQREQCYITISWSGVTGGSSTGYAGSAGSSGSFSTTISYSGTQGTLYINVTIKLVADTGITYSLSTSTTLGTTSSALTAAYYNGTNLYNPNNVGAYVQVTVTGGGVWETETTTGGGETEVYNAGYVVYNGTTYTTSGTFTVYLSSNYGSNIVINRYNSPTLKFYIYASGYTGTTSTYG